MKEQLILLAQQIGYSSFHTINREVGNGWYIELCLLQKWLRETYNTHIIIAPPKTSSIQEKAFTSIHTPNRTHTIWYNNEGWISYEEALEIALQEALKLITK